MNILVSINNRSSLDARPPARCCATPGLSTSLERAVTHMIDVARALSFLAKDEEALELFLSAEQQAPTSRWSSTPSPALP